MAADLPPRPVRRSPLESIHASRGARWVDQSSRWPESYADPRAEAAAAARGAGIADVGPVDKLMIRGSRTNEALLAAGIVPATGSVVSAVDGTEAWCLADDEVLLLVATSAISDVATGVGARARRLRAVGAGVTDLSSGLGVLRLIGPACPALLERVCAVDLAPSAVPAGRIVQAPVAGVRLVMARQGQPEAPVYTLLVARDLAEYLWGALLDVGSDLGLVPVGGAVARSGLVGGGTEAPT